MKSSKAMKETRFLNCCHGPVPPNVVGDYGFSDDGRRKTHLTRLELGTRRSQERLGAGPNEFSLHIMWAELKFTCLVSKSMGMG